MRGWLIRKLGGYPYPYDDSSYYREDIVPLWTRFANLFRREEAPQPAPDRVIHMDGVITELDADMSSFNTLLMKCARPGQVIYWLEDDFMPRVTVEFKQRPWGEWTWQD